MDAIVSIAKRFINVGNLDGLKEYFESVMTSTESGEDLDYAYLFRHIYVHACLRKQVAIVTWLKELYETMDPIMKIALRQIFGYGEHLLRK
jgi:hypothetical protein